MNEETMKSNGGSENDPEAIPGVVTPDMLYKLSKKIAQLTKVIYSLNTKNDDLEVDLETMKASYEDKLQQQLSNTNHSTDQQGPLTNGDNHSDELEILAKEAKSAAALAEAMQALQQTEGKLKAMEADFNKKQKELEHLQSLQALHTKEVNDFTCQTSLSSSSTEMSSSRMLEQQMKQLSKENQELKFRVDRYDVINESLRLETETLKSEVQEISGEKNKLQLELSAARIQINYDKEVGNSIIVIDSNSAGSTSDQADNKTAAQDDQEADKFADELLEKIEKLTEEKALLSKALEEAAASNNIEGQVIETMKHDQGEQTDEVKMIECQECRLKSGQITSLESQVEKLGEEKLHYDSARQIQHEHEELTKAKLEQAELAAEQERQQNLSNLRSERRQWEDELQQVRDKHAQELQDAQRTRLELESRLGQVEAARESLLGEKQSLCKELSDGAEATLALKVDMGQNAEKLYAVEERCKGIEKERDDLKRRCKEFEARLDVLNRSERAAEKDASEKLEQLEKALEEALVEREEILEAAEKEIDNHKTIALETEQKMMDDFEWKLREIEGEYRDKIKTLEESVEAKVCKAKEELVREKDEEFTRISINMRREMDDKIRMERNALNSALEAQFKGQKDKAVELYRLEKDHEVRILQRSWQTEQERLNREIEKMQRKVDNLPDQVEAATRTLKAECASRVKDEQRKVSQVERECQAENDRIRLEMSGQMRRLQSQCDEKIAAFEAKLEAAHGNRMSSMFQMKEEVEVEFSDKMEQLRDMYHTEMEGLAQKLEQEQTRASEVQEALRHQIQDKQAEIDDLNTYYTQREEDLEAKINDLLTRLQDQTALAVKLQAEIDEYEWYEEDPLPEGGGGQNPEGSQSRPPSSRSQHRNSRPPSTKPLEQHKCTGTESITEEDSETIANAAHNNYVSMTSLYATAQTASSAEVSSSSIRTGSPHPPRPQPPLAEEAFLTESEEVLEDSSGATAAHPPPPPQQQTNNSEDFEDIIGIADPEEEDDDDEPEEASKKWHHKLLKSASGVLRGQESPSQCVNEPGGAEAEDGDGLLDSLDEGLFSTSSVSSPLKSQPPSNPASSLTNSLILAMTLILIMHAMIANL